ncbi:hypothetical protein LCGC14_2424850 [marine sediment metagenome]|uniref:Terminase small subunit n=1 Tax=marine sediment metagenome TaxID=412755 RepID=A0A0F9CAT3_9ZZZZ
MPSIKDQSTVEAVAREFCSNGRDKAQSMRTVGYAESSCKSGKAVGDVYGNLRVRQAIAAIEAGIKAEHVADREERKLFWSKTMKTAPNMCDRLRASELLGKSECDFIDVGLTGVAEVPTPVTVEQVDEFRLMARAAIKKRLSEGA